MAEVDIAPNFGLELKVTRDGFKPVNAWVANGIAWLEDIQQFYRERSAIEKEYSGKLAALAKKYFEKKARKTSLLSVGDTPTVSPGSLESASMTTWTVQLNTLESRANEHDTFATQLISHVAEPLRILGTRYEELRKYHAEYATKLEKERDSVYTDHRKTKGKYDAVCQEVENRRKKTESSFDHGKTKAQVAYQQQLTDMYNAKNTYLISMNVTNKQKEMYYHEYVPELLNSMQDLSETRISKVNSIWSLASQIETTTLTRSTELMTHLSSEIPRNNPLLDSMMFVRHNVSQWQDPADFVFEPSPVWHDDSSMYTDDASKNFLRNILTKSKGQLVELRRDTEKKKRDVENAKRARQNIREGKDKRDEVEAVRAIFALLGLAHESERQMVTAEVEVTTITQAVGDVSIGAKNHNFKSQTFKIPTNCDLCGERIWGLSAKGFDCTDCGYTCHSKCELKAPANCPGEQTKEEKKKLKASRQAQASAAPASNGMVSPTTTATPSLTRSDTINSMNTLSSGYSATAHRSVSGVSTIAPDPSPSMDDAPKFKPAPATRKNRIVAPPPVQYIKDTGSDVGSSNGDSNKQRGNMMYPYQANGEGEISLEEGREITVLEPDDGGWIKVRAGSLEGLVPTAYVDLTPSSPPPTAHSLDGSHGARPGSTYSASSVSLAGSISKEKKKGPAVAPKRGAKKLKYVEALYDYDARSEAEHSMREGERFVVITRDAGDGWADVERGGKVGSVPANYVQDV
ncbi:FCH-domain-containing protein [Patellaria atrata CBS 101060]|uniref:Protein BZZ1 n=1 Tax=Patellaria atrata CBS 101060 TaxID=1346257 RepID=A0A9P4VSC8_9PEZI|nr:FCH-domain-containing protein [Patellaria atrata CBS 101060]